MRCRKTTPVILKISSSSGFQTPEALQAGIADGSVDQFKASYAANGGLQRDQVATSYLDDLIKPEQTALFNQNVDRAVTDQNMGAFDGLQQSALGAEQYGALDAKFKLATQTKTRR